MSSGYTKLRDCTRDWRKVLTPTQWALVCVAIDRTEGWQRDSAPISHADFACDSNVSRSTVKTQVRWLVNHGPLTVVDEGEGKGKVKRPVKVYEVDYEWVPAAKELQEVENRRAREKSYKRTRREGKEEPLQRGRPREQPADDQPAEESRGLNKNPHEDEGWGLTENPRRGLNKNPHRGQIKTPDLPENPHHNGESGDPKDRRDIDDKQTDLPSVGLSGDRTTKDWVKFKEKVEGMNPDSVSQSARQLGDEVRRKLVGSNLDVPVCNLRCLADLLGAEAHKRMHRVARKNARYARKETVDDPWRLFVYSVWGDLDERPPASAPARSAGAEADDEGKGAGKVAEDPELQQDLAQLDQDLGAGGVLEDAVAELDPETGERRVAPLTEEHAELIRESVGDRLAAAGWRLAERDGREARKKGEVA